MNQAPLSVAPDALQGFFDRNVDVIGADLPASFFDKLHFKALNEGQRSMCFMVAPVAVARGFDDQGELIPAARYEAYGIYAVDEPTYKRLRNKLNVSGFNVRATGKLSEKPPVTYGFYSTINAAKLKTEALNNMLRQHYRHISQQGDLAGVREWRYSKVSLEKKMQDAAPVNKEAHKKSVIPFWGNTR